MSAPVDRYAAFETNSHTAQRAAWLALNGPLKMVGSMGDDRRSDGCAIAD